MTDSVDAIRPVSRWLYGGAVVAAASTLVLLVLGQLVTSFRAGMADPVWPTEPWYLFSNYRLDFGYLVEHTHRIAGFTVGGVVALLAMGLWWTEPRSAARWTAIASLVILLAGFGEFHRGLMAQRNVPPAEVRLPLGSVGVTVIGLVGLFGVGLSGLLAGVRGAGLRLLGATALVAVMIQGLLGGFRVKLNELVGTDLAAVHGVFAQVVFCLLISLAVLTERPIRDAAPGTGRRDKSLRQWSVALAALLFVQVIWGAMIRHDPTPLTQRLHFMSAFLVLAMAVWLLRGLFAEPILRQRLGWLPWVIVGLLSVQLYLGIEAWLTKFGTYVLPELVPITPENAAIRTAHALVGSGLLASAVALAVRFQRTTWPKNRTPDSTDVTWA